MGNFFEDLGRDIKTAAVPAVLGFVAGGPVGAVAAGTLAVVQKNKAQAAADRTAKQAALSELREIRASDFRGFSSVLKAGLAKAAAEGAPRVGSLLQVERGSGIGGGGRRAIRTNLGVRIPDRPAVSSGVTIDRPITLSGASTLPSRISSTGLAATARPAPIDTFAEDINMGGFFETLGDNLLAAAPEILQGFAVGGFSGGLAATAAGALGLPPKVQLANRQQALTSGARLASISPAQLGTQTLNRARGGVVGAVAGTVLSDPVGAARAVGFGQGPIRANISSAIVAAAAGTGRPVVGGFGTKPVTTGPTLAQAGKGGGVSNFARDECGVTIKYYCSTTPGQGWTPVRDAPSLGQKPRKPFARLNLASGLFEPMRRRRMNPLNMKALGRARRRQDDALDMIIPMIRDKKKEQAGKKPRVVVKRRKKKRSA